MNTIPASEKLNKLRAEITRAGVDGFIIPRSDEYLGEYVPANAERLGWISGFTGSAGFAIVLKDKAAVMTDGRYAIQIRQQVDSSLFEIEDSTVQSIGGWIAAHAHKGQVIGYDPRIHTAQDLQKWELAAQDKGITFEALDCNLVDLAWDNRPNPPKEKAFVFPAEISGITLPEKTQLMLNAVEAHGGAAGVVALSDSIAWMLNIRGGDLPCVPVVLSHAIINAMESRIEWIVDPDKIPPDVMAYLADNVVIIPPKDMDKYLANIAAAAKAQQRPVLVDPARTPVYFRQRLSDCGAQIKDYKDPCIDPRAQKTESEKAGIEKAHILDGAAVVKFLHWLDKQAGAKTLTEMDVEKTLEGFRKESPDYRGASFDTIAGFAENGAIIHYHASTATNKTIDKDGLLLVDSGGQYPFGTTDITRTIAIGSPTEEMRSNYTRVLKGHIALANAKFPQGTLGKQVDALARAPLWAAGLDFDHGTGHGVGCYLSVHEETASISTRGNDALKVGMLISNEPGFYKEGAYGIRIENLVMVEEAGRRVDKNSTVMLGFNTVTLAPYDRRLIKPEMLSVEEKTWLKNYHARVYQTLKPLLSEEQADWLRAMTVEL